MRKIIVPLIAFLMITLAAVFFLKLTKDRSQVVFVETKSNIEGSSEIVRDEKKEDDTIVVDVDESEEPLFVELPEKVMIDVPFLVQAPFGNWDEIHEDACEESSLIMLEYYLRGEKNISPEEGENEIQKVVEFQVEKYGKFEDTNVAETIQMAKDFYGRDNLRAVYDFEKERIKEELAKGNPVILAIAGREIGNPNYTSPGPLYHNIVLVGYDGDTIYTNDPGTKNGENYPYSIDVLYSASHDFTGRKEDINQGRKAMIVVR